GFAEYSWVIVGLAAVPSTIVWSWCAERMGHIQALMIAFLLQAIGVVLPVWSPNVLGITLGAILFGGTFLGITALSMTAARLMRSAKSGEAIGLMTGFFGIGQILGPIGAGIAAKWTNSYSLSLILAAFIIGGAVGLLLIGWAINRSVSTGRP
ncbi:MAG: YbfB/YjiJ family MFS transporter, partial [Kyrpidia sp.]|nr:YbfB/YjiJ family MFS transporter [Kyrpidia sp.]